MSSSLGKIALLIDGANLYATSKTLGFDIDYKRLLKEFQSRGTLLRALPGERLFCHRHRRDTALDPIGSMRNRQLDASTAASGPHDFAVRSSHTRQLQLSRPPHLTARS